MNKLLLLISLMAMVMFSACSTMQLVPSQKTAAQIAQIQNHSSDEYRDYGTVNPPIGQQLPQVNYEKRPTSRIYLNKEKTYVIEEGNNGAYDYRDETDSILFYNYRCFDIRGEYNKVPICESLRKLFSLEPSKIAQ